MTIRKTVTLVEEIDSTARPPERTRTQPTRNVCK